MPQATANTRLPLVNSTIVAMMIAPAKVNAVTWRGVTPWTNSSSSATWLSASWSATRREAWPVTTSDSETVSATTAPSSTSDAPPR